MSSPIFGAHSRLDSDTVTVSPGSATGFPPANLGDDRLYTYWKASASGTTFVKTDTTGSAASVSYFGMASHNLFTVGATLAFQGSPDNSTWTTIFTTTPTDNLIILRAFTAVSYRYYRAYITGASAAVQIGELSWGVAVDPGYGFEVGFDPNEEDLNARYSESQTGNILGVVLTFTGRRTGVKLRLIPDSFIRDNTTGGFKDFWDNHASKFKPFFFAWNKDTAYEKDGYFAIVDTGSRIRRPLVTPLSTGYRDLEFDIIGVKE